MILNPRCWVMIVMQDWIAQGKNNVEIDFADA